MPTSCHRILKVGTWVELPTILEHEEMWLNFHNMMSQGYMKFSSSFDLTSVETGRAWMEVPEFLIKIKLKREENLSIGCKFKVCTIF